MDELRRHQMVFKVLMPFIHIFTKLKFNYQYDSLKDVEGPYLLVANHNLELDPVLVGEAVGKHIYFVASEHIARWKTLYAFLKYAFTVSPLELIEILSTSIATSVGSSDVPHVVFTI